MAIIGIVIGIILFILGLFFIFFDISSRYTLDMYMLTPYCFRIGIIILIIDILYVLIFLI